VYNIPSAVCKQKTIINVVVTVAMFALCLLMTTTTSTFSQPDAKVLLNSVGAKLYCQHALVDSNQHIWIREKMLQSSSIGVTYTISTLYTKHCNIN